ncbi:MAG: phasin family protein [Anaerolineae bacterium]
MEAKVTTKKVKAPAVEVPTKAEVAVDGEKVAEVAQEVAEPAEGAVKGVLQMVPHEVRRVYLASIGALSLAWDETEGLFNKLVDEGESAEKEGRQWFKRVAKESKETQDKVTGQVDERFEKGHDRVEQTVEKVLARLNVPTKADIDRLSRQIVELSQKVEELKTK